MSSGPTTDATTLRMTRLIPAPVEIVFNSWTVPTEIKRWWSPEGFTTPVAEVDLRVGGTYRIGMKSPDGEVLYVSGTYREVAPPSKLVFTWAWDEDGTPGHESLITIEFIARGKATEVAFTHEHLLDAESRDKHAHGWVGCFDKLSALFE
jgi:uncharacterized protein YndB with AHSA1/START domain